MAENRRGPKRKRPTPLYEDVEAKKKMLENRNVFIGFHIDKWIDMMERLGLNSVGLVTHILHVHDEHCPTCRLASQNEIHKKRTENSSPKPVISLPMASTGDFSELAESCSPLPEPVVETDYAEDYDYIASPHVEPTTELNNEADTSGLTLQMDVEPGEVSEDLVSVKEEPVWDEEYNASLSQSDNSDSCNDSIVPVGQAWQLSNGTTNDDNTLPLTTDAVIKIEKMVEEPELSASSSLRSNKLVQESSMSDNSDLPIPEPLNTQATGESSKKRFKVVKTDKIKELESSNQSKSTKKNTRWGTKILQDWHTEIYGQPLDLSTVSPDELAEKLAKFYCEATPQEDKKFDIYHKNTLKNIRSAINRHLSDINSGIDIVHDKAFKRANSSLNGLLRDRITSGMSRPTKHKETISKEDLRKISAYLRKAYRDPVALRLCVWYILSIHFVTRGLEWHHKLTKNAFQFQTDENGNEYVSLTEETRRCYQVGSNSSKANSDKRMYATNTETCPVKMLKFFIDKNDKYASRLFNKISIHARKYPAICDIWYTTSSVGKTSFCEFFPDLCKAAGCSKRYTPHCLRATVMQAMSDDAGVETRQIMFMSGHRNEASMKTYLITVPLPNMT